jgi:hypothetical protein
VPVDRFVQRLASFTPLPRVFNPWRQCDARDRDDADAAAIRRDQLGAYLAARRRSATLLLVAEALSARGGRFSGVPMTSERILLGHDPRVCEALARQHLSADADLLPGRALRTSNADALRHRSDRHWGVYERTAAIVWRTMLLHEFAPTAFALWNAFPFHPFGDGGLCTNRTPTPTELGQTAELLRAFLTLFRPDVKIVALGRKAEATLTACGVAPFRCASHPVARPLAAAIASRASPASPTAPTARLASLQEVMGSMLRDKGEPFAGDRDAGERIFFE